VLEGLLDTVGLEVMVEGVKAGTQSFADILMWPKQLKLLQ